LWDLQAPQLFDDEEQEEHGGQDRAEEILSELQEAHAAQRDQVTVGGAFDARQ
jgi:hypothetical protein